MEEAPENDKESSQSSHANGMNEWMNQIKEVSRFQDWLIFEVTQPSVIRTAVN